MITVSAARDSARTKLRTKRASWAADGTGAVWAIALKPPTEREMLLDQQGAEQWAREWASLAPAQGLAIEWEQRTWRSIGRQNVPVRLALDGADTVAMFAGGQARREWELLRQRADAVRATFGATDAVAAVIRRHAELVLSLKEERFDGILVAGAWLHENPVRGLRPRQLPLRGVDTKWFAAHRGILSALYSAASGGEDLGIVDSDPLVRVRVLDTTLAIDGLVDFAAPAAQLGTLPFAPEFVFVFENLESVLAMPEWPGAIAVHGSGYAVDVAGSLPWVQGTRVIYWGDLDSNGFAILHRLRMRHPDVVSVLMDEDTLTAHPDLWVLEPTPNRGEFNTLTGSEARALQRLRDEGDVRLEQERVPWVTALEKLRVATGRDGLTSPRAPQSGVPVASR